MENLSALQSGSQGHTEGWKWLRTRLESGESVIGLGITTANLETAVLGAELGFDFLWVEMEHAPVSLEALRGIVLATRSLGVSVFARVPVVGLWTAKRVLDQGVSGVVFPFVSDPESARIAALSCRYPPAGLRGSGAGLAASTSPERNNYYDYADANVLTVCVIEDKQALGNIDEIAAVPGIDVLFIGTSDLSFSLGFRGRRNESVLNGAIQTIIAAARRHNKFLGCPANSAEEVLRYREQGFQLFHLATELELMRLGARQLLQPLSPDGSVADKRRPQIAGN